MVNQKSGYLAAGIASLLFLGLIFTLAGDYLTGFVVSIGTMIFGFVLGAMIRPQTELGHDLGFSSLDRSDSRKAMFLLNIAIFSYIFLAFPGLFFIIGLMFLAYAGFTFVTSSIPEDRQVNVFLRRLGVAFLFFLAQLFSVLLVLPIIFVLTAFVLVFLPQRYKRMVGGDGR